MVKSYKHRTVGFFRKLFRIEARGPRTILINTVSLSPSWDIEHNFPGGVYPEPPLDQAGISHLVVQSNIARILSNFDFTIISQSRFQIFCSVMSLSKK